MVLYLLQNKKKLYALICETLKYTSVIMEITESEKILKKEKCLNKHLMLPLVYDLLFGKGLEGGSKVKVVFIIVVCHR